MTLAVLFMTLISILLRASLIKYMDWKHLEKNQPKTENVPLVPLDDKANVMKILHGTNETAIKNLIINSKDDQLKTNLHFLNMDGTRSENVAIRRETNKKFMVCLRQIQIDKPSTLVWLKSNNEFGTCQRMISDWKFSGENLHLSYITKGLGRFPNQ